MEARGRTEAAEETHTENGTYGRRGNEATRGGNGGASLHRTDSSTRTSTAIIFQSVWTPQRDAELLLLL